ncbi:MAG: tryptophan synthase subunit beta [Pseudomonadales bacterium]
MPYVKRDEAGQIISVSLSQESDDQEFIDAENAQLAAFFEDARASADSLRESDSDLVRVLEDLIEMLTAKGIILFTELPESAQQKIMLRKRLRKDRSNSLDLLGDE